MGIIKKVVGKPAPGVKAMSLTPPSKGKPSRPGLRPGTPKPAAPAKPAAAPKPAIKSSAKPARPDPRSGTPKAPAPKVPAAKPAPILNKGALAAKAVKEARAAAAAQAAAARAAEEAKRPRKLVPATANAIRPGAAKQAPAKGKGSAPRPPAEVRPLGVLPPESMAKAKAAPSNTASTVRIGARPAGPQAPPNTTARPAAATAARAKGDDRLNDADLKHFETRLLEERARIMREMGHLENTILKVNPRDSAGEVGGYSFHMADAGTDSMEREISFDIASKEGRLLREIDDALRRIYNGVFGICEASGKPIARVRLEALPWARYTIEEQANMEKQQRAGRLVKEEE